MISKRHYNIFEYVDFHPFDDINELTEELRRYYSNRSFKFGYSDFLPKVDIIDEKHDQSPKDPFIELMYKIGHTIGATNIEPIKFNWDRFYNELEEGKFHTIVDPILSSPSRKSFIIPIFILTSGIMLYHQNLTHIVQSYIHSIRRIKEDYFVIETYRIPKKIKNLIRELHKGKKGFIVKEGFLEKDILELSGIRPTVISSNGLSNEDIFSIIKDEHIMLIDSTTFINFATSLDKQMYSNIRVNYMLDCPIHTVAGFPVKLENWYLQTFLQFHLLSETGIINNTLKAIPLSLISSYQKKGIYILPTKYMPFLIDDTISRSWCNVSLPGYETLDLNDIKFCSLEQIVKKLDFGLIQFSTFDNNLLESLDSSKKEHYSTELTDLRFDYPTRKYFLVQRNIINNLEKENIALTQLLSYKYRLKTLFLLSGSSLLFFISCLALAYNNNTVIIHPSISLIGSIISSMTLILSGWKFKKERHKK